MPIAPDEIRYVTLTYSQVMMARFLHKLTLEQELYNIYLHPDATATQEDYIEQGLNLVESFRLLDDCLLDGLEIMARGSGALEIDFRFNGAILEYMSSLASRTWTASDMILPREADTKEEIAKAINEHKDDLFLSLRSASRERLKVNMATLTGVN